MYMQFSSTVLFALFCNRVRVCEVSRNLITSSSGQHTLELISNLSTLLSTVQTKNCGVTVPDPCDDEYSSVDFFVYNVSRGFRSTIEYVLHVQYFPAIFTRGW